MPERDRTVALHLTPEEYAALKLVAEVEQRPVAAVLRERADLSKLLREAQRIVVLCGMSPDPPLQRVAALGRPATDAELATFWGTLDVTERDELLRALEDLTRRLERAQCAPGVAMRRYMDQAVVALVAEGRPHELIRYAIVAQPWEKHVGEAAE